MEKECVDAEQNDQTRRARRHSQVRTRTGKKHFSCSADHEQNWQPYTVDPHSAESVDHEYSSQPGRLLMRDVDDFYGAAWTAFDPLSTQHFTIITLRSSTVFLGF